MPVIRLRDCRRLKNCSQALSLGVALSACQSGMSLAGLSLADLPPGTEVTGPIALLQAQTEADRLIFA